MASGRVVALKWTELKNSLFSLFCKSCIAFRMDTFHIYLDDVQDTNIWKYSG